MVKSSLIAKVDKVIPVRSIESGPIQADPIDTMVEITLGSFNPVSPTIIPKSMAIVIGLSSFLAGFLPPVSIA